MILYAALAFFALIIALTLFWAAYLLAAGRYRVGREPDRLVYNIKANRFEARCGRYFVDFT